jgi:periplasmic copper chaperone A
VVKRSLKIYVACASALLVALAACGVRDEPAPADATPTPARAVLAVKDAWARAADSGATSAVYFTITNSALVPDTLAGARSALAEEAGLHMSMQHDRTMHMAALQSLPVPADDSVLFAPLGAHVMLTRLTRAIAAGDTVALTLTFVSGQSLEVRAGVRKP